MAYGKAILSKRRRMQLRIAAFPVKRYKYFQPTITACSLEIKFSRVSRIKSKYLNDSAVLHPLSGASCLQTILYTAVMITDVIVIMLSIKQMTSEANELRYQQTTD